MTAVDAQCFQRTASRRVLVPVEECELLAE